MTEETSINRLVVNNLLIEDARSIKRQLEASGLPIKLTTGYERGHHPAAWTELILTAQWWAQHGADLLNSLGSDARAFLVGKGIEYWIKRRLQNKKAPLPAQLGPAENEHTALLLEILLSKQFSRVVLTVVSAGTATARLTLRDPSREDLIRAFAYIAATADQIEKVVNEDSSDRSDGRWELSLAADSIQIKRHISENEVVTHRLELPEE